MQQKNIDARTSRKNTGILRPDIAYTLNATGIAGRASALPYDVRKNHPYCAYRDLSFATPTMDYGDVNCRFHVRLSECIAAQCR